MKKFFSQRYLEDYILVTLITLVIWFYAEAQTLERYVATQGGSVAIELRHTNVDRVVTDASVKRLVTLEFTGSRYAIGKLRAAVSGGIVIEVDASEAGHVTLPLAQLISEQYKGFNVSVERVEPERIEFDVVKIVEREASLRFSAKEVTLQEAPVFEPATVRVRVPEDRLDELEVDGKIVLDAVATREVVSLPANTQQSVQANVKWPEALGPIEPLSVTPAVVTVKFIIAKKDVTHTLSTVPVSVRCFNLADHNSYEFELPDESRFLLDVKVTGSAVVIEEFRSGSKGLRAWVELSSDEVKEMAKLGEGVFPVRIDPVPGVVIENPKQTVRVTVKPRGP